MHPSVFRRDVSAHLKAGTNTLEVKVVNLWCNRVIGDVLLHENQRRTRTNITRLTVDTPLEPFGLLGPSGCWPSRERASNFLSPSWLPVHTIEP